nr:reductive dehalogenase [uncultured bacterium]
MSKFHSTVSRRDFMKGLGLAGAGIGGASLLSPGFNDLDELVAASASDNPSTTSMMKRPWWVKEVDKPTVEIDLNLREPWTGTNAATGVIQGKYGTLGSTQALFAKQAQNSLEGAKNNRPGWTLRDQILVKASLDRSHYLNKTSHPVEGLRSISTYADLGVPKYQGSLEENAFMMRTVLAGFGASKISYVEIDDTNVGPRERLFHPNQMLFGDGDDISYQGNIPIVPKKCKYLITIYAGRQLEGKAFSPLGFAFYQEKYEWVGKVQNFLWGLGYQAYHTGDAGNTGTPVPTWAILGGVGEYNRTHNPPVTPEGQVGEGGIALITDLPLPPTKPIDFGVLRFCETCGVCAEVCPAGAIPTKEEVKEPTWERATGPWSSSNDHKGYPNYSPKCAEFWMTECCSGIYNRPNATCGLCASNCVFSTGDKVWSHELIKATVSNTSILNSFFYQMDINAGYHELPTEEDLKAFWSTDYPNGW